MTTTDRNCSGCRYWSEMIARAGGGTTNPDGKVEALCLAPYGSPYKSRYTTKNITCDSFAKNSHGRIDDMATPGQPAPWELYLRDSRLMHPNGAPMFSADGTMLDDMGNRSTFDDVDTSDIPEASEEFFKNATLKGG